MTLSSTYGHLIYIPGTGSTLTFDHIAGTLGAGYIIHSASTGPNLNYAISNSNFTGGVNMYLKNNTGSTISNNIFTGQTLNAIWLSADANILLQDNVANNITSTAFYDTDSSTITYRHNIVNVAGQGFSSNNGSGNIYDLNESYYGTSSGDYLMVGTSHDYIYTSNTSKDSTGDGFVITDTAHNASYYYNTTDGNGNAATESVGDGFTAHNQNYGLIYAYNIIKNNKTAGFAMIGNSEGEIYNNVVYNNANGNTNADRGGIYIGVSGLNSNGKSWRVKNNVVSNNYPYEINLTASAASVVSFDYNDIWPLDPNKTATVDFGTHSLTWAQYHISPNIFEPHSINVDPQFVSASDFHLQNLSPAINAGTNVGLTTDYEGNPKSGANWDIGAYEFQDSTAPTTTANINSGTYNTHQSVILTCDDGSGVGCDKTYYTLDNSDPTTSSTVYATPISIPDNATTVLKFFSTDKNANSETIKSKTYTVDTVAPDTLIDTNPNSNTSSTSATFTFHASETATFQCKLDSGSYASCTSPKNYTALTEGSHTFYIQATDTATNVDPTPASFIWTVDTTPPTISFSNDVETDPVQSDVITASWGDATVKKWDYNANATCSTTASDYSKTDIDLMNQTTQTNNTKFICLYAEDALGNKSTLASANQINIVLPVATTSSDSHKHKTHHKAKPKPKTFQQKFTKKLTDTKKWFKKQNTTINRNLSLGSRGQDVGTLQAALQKLGLLQIKDTTYGVYKSLTKEAVTKLQQIKNIFPTGNFGSLTRNLFGW